MQTNFTAEQLRDPDTAVANQVLRTCVHCGFCTATCPTFVLLGDELDSPRGRIYLIKDMLETGRPATEEVVRHVDRCLSCLSCMTTCPSGVNYMHLVDHARALHRGDLPPALARAAAARRAGARAAAIPAGSALALPGARLARPFGGLMPGQGDAGAAAARDAGARARRAAAAERRSQRPQVHRGAGRAARPRGAAGRLRAAGAGPAINEATIRLLTRMGVEVVVAARRRLLRRADAPHGPARPGDGHAPAPTSPPGRREIGRRGAGRHRDQHLRLRHDGEGLRLHVPHRAGAARQAERVSGAGAGRLASS